MTGRPVRDRQGLPPPARWRGAPAEPEHLGVALAGRDAPEAVAVWTAVRKPPLDGVAIRGRGGAGLHPTRSARWSRGQPVGVVGEIDPAVARPGASASGWRGWRSTWTPWPGCPGGPAYRPVSRFPSNDIDLAFVVDDVVPAGAVEARSASPPASCWPGPSVRRLPGRSGRRGQRSLAYALRLQADDRTLKDGEVAEVRQRVIDAVESTHGASLRG